MSDYVLQIRVKNGPMLRALRASQYKTGANLSRACGVQPSVISAYLNLRTAPIGDDGDCREDILTIAAYLRASPEDLFPPQHLRRRLECNAAEVDASLDDIAGYIGSAGDGLRMLEQTEILGRLGDAVKSLPARYRTALEMRHGLHGNGEHSLDEIAAEIGGVSRERARQILLKGERMLREKLSGERVGGKIDISAFD